MIRIVLHSPPLTVADVAQKLDVSKQRILDLLHEGRIEGAFKLGGTWYITSQFRIRPGTRDGGHRKRRGDSLADLG